MSHVMLMEAVEQSPTKQKNQKAIFDAFIVILLKMNFMCVFCLFSPVAMSLRFTQILLKLLDFSFSHLTMRRTQSSAKSSILF